MEITLTLNCEIEKFRSGENYYCLFRKYNLSGKSLNNFDEAESILIDKIYKYIEENTWNKNYGVELKFNYK